MAKPLSIAAMVAAGLVLLTLAAGYIQRSKKDDPLAPRPVTRSVEAAPATAGHCAIVHARFGGRGAQLIKVMKGSVPNFVVVEAGRRDPLLRLQRVDWLRATYDGAEQSWLGEFSSADAAMVRAARLCPPSQRCWPGDADCGPQAQALTPAQVFFHQ